MIYEQFGELKFEYRNREFWCRGYYVDTVGKNKQKIAEYIKHQMEENRLGEQMTMLGMDDDIFKGSQKKSKKSLFTGNKQFILCRYKAVYAPAYKKIPAMLAEPLLDTKRRYIRQKLDKTVEKCRL